MQSLRPFVFFTFLAAVFTLPCAPVLAQSEGLGFIDRALWDAQLSPTSIVLGDGFESIVNVDGVVIEGSGLGLSEIAQPQQFAWGQLSSTATPGTEEFVGFQVTFFGVPQPVSVSLVNNARAIFDLDPSLGQVDGLFFQGRDGALQIRLFDGDTLVATLLESEFDPVRVDGMRDYGWINSNGLNVTRFEILVEPTPGRSSIPTIANLDFAFIPLDEAPAPPAPADTCFQRLADVRAEIETLLASSEGKDAVLLQGALDLVTFSQDDVFWVQPSADRLSAYGGSVFLASAYAIVFLERAQDPQSDGIIDALLDTLDCLVDREIEYAIANDGRGGFIERAMDLAELADIIDEDLDNQVVASLAYKLAWVNAFYSTY